MRAKTTTGPNDLLGTVQAAWIEAAKDREDRREAHRRGPARLPGFNDAASALYTLRLPFYIYLFLGAHQSARPESLREAVRKPLLTVRTRQRKPKRQRYAPRHQWQWRWLDNACCALPSCPSSLGKSLGTLAPAAPRGLVPATGRRPTSRRSDRRGRKPREVNWVISPDRKRPSARGEMHVPWASKVHMHMS